MGSNTGKEQHIVAYGTYVLVWLCLVILTGIAVYVSSLDLGNFRAFVAILIASMKAVLILYFFMHLKYERFTYQLMLLLVIATLSVIIGMTFFDVGLRY